MVENNDMKLNQDKCHLLVSGYKNENLWTNIGNEKILESNKQKLLRLDIDRNLNFNEHASSLCRKAGNKLSVLARLSNFMSFKQRRIPLKTFIGSQFGYCLLIWMFHSRRVCIKKDASKHQLNRSLYLEGIHTIEKNRTVFLQNLDIQ